MNILLVYRLMLLIANVFFFAFKNNINLNYEFTVVNNELIILLYIICRIPTYIYNDYRYCPLFETLVRKIIMYGDQMTFYLYKTCVSICNYKIRKHISLYSFSVIYTQCNSFSLVQFCEFFTCIV